MGLALPLLAATGAQAAPTPVWDKVAGCETGGNWSADSGDGYHGGLRFTDSTWAAYGGTEFAPSADRATRSQQIAVAERVLAAEGEGGWGTCAQQAGLSRDGVTGVVDVNDSADETGSLRGSRGVDMVNAAQDGSLPAAHTTPVFSGLPGWDPVYSVYWYEQDGGWFWTSHHSVYEHHVSSAAAKAAKAAQDARNAQGTTAPATTAPVAPVAPVVPVDPTLPTAPVTTTPTLPTDPTGTPTDPTVPPVTVDPTAPVTGDPTLPVAPPVDPTAPATGPTTPTVPGADATAPAAPTAQPSSPATESAPPAATPKAYTVQAGDTLASIARNNGLQGGWKGLYEANKLVVGENPDLLKPGLVLQLGQ
ncbi:transglycosylase family protein [Kitasatospora sp. NPDC048365]|uniref:transglycosylase family protein n=1 Tax=Kitasatospora sp. NPDC048365 TaxID=3364050 RepID=UPI0037249865